MSAFYDRLEATAKRLIDKYGFGADLLRQGPPTGPPYAPVPGVDVPHPCRIVETGYSLTNRDATLVVAGDKLGIISTDIDVVPALSDRIEIGGQQYHFLDVAPLSPGGQTLLYEFHARA